MCILHFLTCNVDDYLTLLYDKNATLCRVVLVQVAENYWKSITSSDEDQKKFQGKLTLHTVKKNIFLVIAEWTCEPQQPGKFRKYQLVVSSREYYCYWRTRVM